MRVINATNVNDALIKGLMQLSEFGVDRDSRNGPVRMFSGPVTTRYANPTERVIFHPERDANPYFHFMESLWMLAGRNDVSWVSQFSGNMVNFSDDGEIFHGAYGYRWRQHFDEVVFIDGAGVEVRSIDQLSIIANVLKQNHDDRRVVLQMWDTVADLGQQGKDFPCNLIATFSINPYGKLDMTVFNRSNDMIWGAYGANAVHFSVLQEVMAAWVGVPIGEYWQVSTNFHAYHNTLDKHGHVILRGNESDPYEFRKVVPFPIVNTPIDTWFSELNMFMTEGSVIGYTDPFFKKVAVPMLNSWKAWKDKDNIYFMEDALRWAHQIAASDWKMACVEWLDRRAKK